ncbi:MAG: hypothetical protein KJO13_08145 [Gammaproteobacteria bacterium]|nr:hypothetical protein [Gammaproteobacteria bacterium]
MTNQPRIIFVCLALVAGNAAFAQGQDGTPGERNLQVMAELLAGLYDNANQNYFDGRLKFPEDERHDRARTEIATVEDDRIGSPLFAYDLYRGRDASPSESELWLLTTDDDPRLVRMKRYTLGDDEATYREGCDVLWRRNAGQFWGINKSDTCAAELQLTTKDLWLTIGQSTLFELARARNFSCYVDIPGVSGGRDEPFDRYPINDMHDQGALQWFESKEGRTFGLTLRNVRWPMNNEVGAFTRNSLVMYLIEKTDDGVKEIGYSWTEPRAERIGMNLKWLLVSCYMVSNRDVQPFFD